MEVPLVFLAVTLLTVVSMYFAKKQLNWKAGSSDRLDAREGYRNLAVELINGEISEEEFWELSNKKRAAILADLAWLDSREAKLSTLPGMSIYYYIRDHWVRKQPWKETRSSAL